MNELDLIATLRPEVALPGERDLAAARSKLMSTLALDPRPAAGQERPARPQHARRGRSSVPRRRRRGVVLGAVAAGVAVACVITLAVTAGNSGGHGVGPGQGPQVPATLTAVQFLSAAAVATRHEQAGPSPAPDQYVYSDVFERGSGSAREWLAADGSRTGVIDLSGSQQAGSYSVPACTAAQAESSGCLLAAGFLPALPVSASAVLPYLARLQLAETSPPANQHTPNWLANDTGKAVASLLQTTYLLPAQQAAVFQMLARTPGFEIVRSAADALGRRGVGIYWLYQGSGAMIVFNPVTYRFMGSGTWGQGDVPADGQVPQASHGVVTAPQGLALVSMTIVDSEPGVTPSVQQKLRQKLVLLMRQARDWGARQPGHEQLTIGAVVAEYLREVVHMSPAQVREYMGEIAHINPLLCVRDNPQAIARGRRRGAACPAT
jgi:hypothetical protein